MAYAAGKVADALGTLSDIATPGESIDPFMQMVGEVSTPLKAITGTFRTAVGGVFGGKEERFYTRWYRRMFGEARLFRKQNAEAMKDANKTLSDIEDEQAQGSGSGGKGGFFGMSLGGIARPLAALLRPARGLMKLLKKVPVIGGVIGGIAGIADWLSVENDDNLSRRDKDKAHGKNVGGIAGMFSGAAAGAAAGTLLGPVGTVIGGIVGAFLGDKAGQILGDIVGGWVNDLREYDIPGKITAAWASVVEKWTAVTEAVSSAWDRVTGAFDETLGAIRSALKDWFDIDLPSMDSVKETVWGSVSEGVDYIKSTAVGQGLSVVSDTFDYWFGDSSASNTPATPMIPAVTNVTRQAPAAPKSAMVRPGAPAAPSTVKPITSDAVRPKISVSVTAPDAGQDVRDRGIAHIASGGIAE
ncbi:MAG: hypothetical protein CMN80_03405 [Spongiibacter sp.]|nr:hypothetical protein [Spongiibacter sp.]